MRVVLYGSSLFIEGLEESLKVVPELEVLRLHSDVKDLLGEARRLRPDAVFVEVGALPDEICFGLLKELPGLLLVALDRESSQQLVLSGQQACAETTMDLVKLILKSNDCHLASGSLQD